jgi:hypothetical protein
MLAKKEDKGDEDYKWLVILNYKPIIVLLACTEINTDWSEVPTKELKVICLTAGLIGQF